MICFVVALASEAKYLLEQVDNLKKIKLADKPAYSCTINNKQAIIAISGIGKVSAALTTQLLIDKFNPDYIFNFGTCGGMTKDVQALNYYIVDKCCQYDFDLTKLEDVPLGYIQEYDTVFFPTYSDNVNLLPKATLASADRFTSEENDVNNVIETGCNLCDMEGGAIAQVCVSNNVKLIVLKGVTDVHGSNTAQEQFFKNLNTVCKGFPEIIKKIINELNFK
jgi:adenosylhomocysteine nucleosidase